MLRERKKLEKKVKNTVGTGYYIYGLISNGSHCYRMDQRKAIWEESRTKREKVRIAKFGCRVVIGEDERKVKRNRNVLIELKPTLRHYLLLRTY